MTTAREIIRGALTFHLNRLSPGEAEDADLFGSCLDALDDIADELNGRKSFLFREILTASSPITGTFGLLGTDWAGLVSGDEILGATIKYTSTLDVELSPITMAQYANIAIKTVTTFANVYAHDGADRVYLYPQVSAKVITLRTRQVVSDFADLDTDYSMPKGYKSALTALLAEKMGPSLVSGVPQLVAVAAGRARSQLGGQAINPAILSGGDSSGRIIRIKRGY